MTVYKTCSKQLSLFVDCTLWKVGLRLCQPRFFFSSHNRFCTADASIPRNHSHEHSVSPGHWHTFHAHSWIHQDSATNSRKPNFHLWQNLGMGFGLDCPFTFRGSFVRPTGNPCVFSRVFAIGSESRPVDNFVTTVHWIITWTKKLHQKNRTARNWQVRKRQKNIHEHETEHESVSRSAYMCTVY